MARLKLQTTPPLPQTKLLFPFAPDEPLPVLLARIVAAVLPGERADPEELVLELEGFVVLEGTLRDGDEVRLKLRDATAFALPVTGAVGAALIPVPAASKRKRSPSPAPAPAQPKKRRVPAAAPAPKHKHKKSAPLPQPSSSSSSLSASSSSSSESSASESESNSDESSSESDSESDASSSASSATSSTSSTSSAPSRISSKRPAPIPSFTATAQPKPSPQQPLVPPGQGKSSTHERNLRRRKKRMLERAAAASGTVPLPVPTATTTTTTPPLPAVAQTRSTEPVASPSAAAHAGALRNKNKKPGFAASFAGAERVRIAFDEATPPSTAAAGPSTPQQQLRNGANPHTPAPSSLPAGFLPSNVFVTSVDVEADDWVPGESNLPRASPEKAQWKKKKKNAQAPAASRFEDAQEEERDREAVEAWAREMEVDGACEEAVDTAAGTEEKQDEKDGALLWAKVEAAFEELPAVGAECPPNGSVIAYKTLALDPTTFTPEIMLKLADVIQGPSAEDPAGLMLLRFRKRPDWDEGAMDEEEEGEEAVEEEVEWGTLQGVRLVKGLGK